LWIIIHVVDPAKAKKKPSVAFIVIRIRIHPASKPKNDYASQVYPR
jgi:hypothetical protein